MYFILADHIIYISVLALSSFSYISVALLLFQSQVVPKLFFMQMAFSFHQISRQEDFTTLQRDIMAIEQCVLDNHLTFKM